MDEFSRRSNPYDRSYDRRPFRHSGPEGSMVLDFLGQMIASTMSSPDTTEKLLKISRWVHTAESVWLDSERREDVGPRPLEWYALFGIAECARSVPLQVTLRALIDVYTRLFPDTPSS